MFIGREKELDALAKLYESGRFEFSVVYGRRRVGKTTMLARFASDKNAIFFSAQEHDNRANLAAFSAAVFSRFGIRGISSFDSWKSAFEFLAEKSENERLLIVIDEVAYLAEAERSFPSVLQNVIDHKMLDGKLFLILCASSMSFMEKEILSSKSPLFGRKTSQMEILPFDFFEASVFFGDWDAETKVRAYAVTGGTPLYMRRFSTARPFWDNVRDEILEPFAALRDEPLNLLRQELREPAVYNTIIEAIASGASSLNEIATKTAIPPAKCSAYISSLMNLRILRKEIPVTERVSRKGIYSICDNFFKFWFRYVFPNGGLALNPTELLKSKILPDFNNYIGRAVFEGICADWLRAHNERGNLPFRFSKIGRWWGNDPIKKEQSEIDILAFDDRRAIFAECKWTEAEVGENVLDKLIERSRIFDYNNRYYYIFAKNGFDKAIKKRAGEFVTLISLEELTT